MAKDKMDDVLKGLSDIREIAEKSKDVGAEAKAQIEELGSDTSAKIAEIQGKNLAAEAESKKLQSEIDAIKEEYKDLHKKANKLNIPESGMDEFAAAHSKFKGEFASYLRKGVAPSSEAVEELANAYVKQSIDVNDDRLLKNAAYDMIGEQGVEDGKGFYTFGDMKSVSTGNNPDGGYMVRPDQRTDVSVSRIFESSPMRAISQIITTGSNEVELPIDDNESVSGGWVGETTSPTETGTPAVGVLKIPVHEQYAEPRATQKMLDDSFVDIEAWLSRKTNDILTRTENTAFVSGDGSQKPKGFLSYANWTTPGSYERNKIEQIASGTNGQITADGLRNLQGSLVEAYQPGASFLMKRDGFTAVSLLKDGQGRYLLNERLLAEGADIRLLGKPLFFADDMQSIATDSLSVAYGDYGVGYTIVDRMGIRVLRDPFTAKPFIKFYTTKRVGGDVSNYQAIKTLKLAASL